MRTCDEIREQRRGGGYSSGIKLVFHHEVYAAVLLHAGFAALETERPILAVACRLELNG
jgi:hypothetical protein